MILSTCNFCDAEYDRYDGHTCIGNQVQPCKRPKAVEDETGWAPSREAQDMLADIARVPLDFSPPAWTLFPSQHPSALDTQPGGDHYRKHAIQPVEYIVANGIGFLAGNVIKYATRYKDKGGAEDIRKIIHYAQLILEFEYKETK